jgi:hypothetical protein
MAAARRIVTNTNGWKIKNDSREIMLCRAASAGQPSIIQPSVIRTSPVNWILQSLAKEPPMAYLVWFDATMADGVGFSNAPGTGNPTNVYGRSFFPWSALSN